ncbi:hypothetical protein JW796_02930 [Candidatus Dojkabacteria bacterium]|nr:hypothetical protein [Candidatus Dojkabacteria bacterium]
MQKYKKLSSESKDVSLEVNKEENLCPDCNNKLYFLEAGFLCPVCGYSIETLYID